MQDYTIKNPIFSLSYILSLENSAHGSSTYFPTAQKALVSPENTKTSINYSIFSSSKQRLRTRWRPTELTFFKMTLPLDKETLASFLSWWVSDPGIARPPSTLNRKGVCWAVDGGEGKKSGSDYRSAFIVKMYWAVILASSPSWLNWQSGTREEKVENKEENFEDPGTLPQCSDSRILLSGS